MKKTIVGDIPVEDVDGNGEENLKLTQDKSIGDSTDESRTNDIKDESLNSNNSLSHTETVDDKSHSEEEKVSQNSSSDSIETIKSKSMEEEVKGSAMEVENVSPEPERRSSRLRGKRPKLTEIITTSDEEELEIGDDIFVRKDRKRGKKSILAKYMDKTHLRGKQKRSSVSESRRRDRVRETRGSKRNDDLGMKPPKEFTSGAFVVLKSDFHASATPPIWKIDGKALLQKYTHFVQDGETFYKNTSTYSGWTSNNKDQYYPVTVEFKSQNRQETIVRFDREAICLDESD